MKLEYAAISRAMLPDERLRDFEEFVRDLPLEVDGGRVEGRELLRAYIPISNGSEYWYALEPIVGAASFTGFEKLDPKKYSLSFEGLPLEAGDKRAMVVITKLKKEMQLDELKLFLFTQAVNRA